MNALTTGFPMLTLLTVLPLAGAAVALFSEDIARFALFARSRALRWAFLSGPVYRRWSDGMVERVAWAPSLGIEYHLGVDAWVL